MTNPPATIVVLEHNPYNLHLLSALLTQAGYRVSGVTSLDAFDQEVAGITAEHLVFIDIEGFTEEVWARCEALHARGIPVLVLYSGADDACRRESLQHGAASALAKPLVIQEVLSVIRQYVGSVA